MQSAANADRAAERFGDAAATGLQRIGLVRPALRAAEMREQDDLAALVGDFADRRQHALDARGVADLAVLHGHVEIDAQQHAFAFDVRVVESAELAHGRAPWRDGVRFVEAASAVSAALARLADQISLLSATDVSAMRFEKPHSLSYQESTRTNVPSITLVWSRWKTEEWLSWLKSVETFGWSV